MIALQSLISLALFFVLVFVLFDRHRVDVLRQKLFDIRDRLFDEGMAGNVRFDSHAYMYTRTVINGMIRFSHRISLTRFVMTVALSTEEERSEAKRQVQAVFSASSEKDRQVCNRYLMDANRALVRHLGTSPFSFIVLVPVLALVIGWVTGMSVVSAAVKHFKTQIARLDLLAYEEGRSQAVGHEPRGSLIAHH
ncbi:hypothetical protein FFI97_020505 [Variovorax sp. KBS0712]|uniref:hypothetical protein n=1 Tax=Variovorax sp. KBS0712 TaxID=2578111 RepID=UPI00116E8F31|nr:hypothetical protein [Variovorax sp. KBS0712]TSD56595.1 hypothetical protein FFI97_020505 [Variovorax sp. KBS0712]